MGWTVRFFVRGLRAVGERGKGGEKVEGDAKKIMRVVQEQNYFGYVAVRSCMKRKKRLL
jgi:hypothetical protein